MTKIKICGLSRSQDIEAVNAFLPEYIGFVFALSHRKVSYEQATELRRKLDRRILSVGVFVNAAQKEIIKLCKDGVIDIIQLHGNEDSSYIYRLQSEVSNPVIKALRVQNREQVLDAQSLPCNYLLLDTHQKDTYGGSGKSFDWSMIPSLNKPFFLAGGLNAENIERAATYQPHCLDVSSGVETNGFKDPNKIREIVKIVRKINLNG